MSLESKKKAELVSIARTLDQEVKILRGKLNKTVAEPENLPYYAISYIRENEKFYLVKLKFDSESGVGQVVEKEEFANTMKHMVEYRLKEFVAMVMDRENT